MRRDTLERLAAARADGKPMVRAVDPANGEERLIDPVSDISPLGLAAAEALERDASGRVTVEEGTTGFSYFITCRWSW